MSKVHLFVGSVDGAAEYASTSLHAAFNNQGVHACIYRRPSIEDLLAIPPTDTLLIITSTTGRGELPLGLRPLWRSLDDTKPALTGLRYATAVLGDRSYGKNYCLGGLRLDSVLLAFGATRLQAPLLIDAEQTNNPEDVIMPWGLDIATQQNSTAKRAQQGNHQLM